METRSNHCFLMKPLLKPWKQVDALILCDVLSMLCFCSWLRLKLLLLLIIWNLIQSSNNNTTTIHISQSTSSRISTVARNLAIYQKNGQKIAKNSVIFPNFFVNFTEIFMSITDLLGFIAKNFGNIPKLMVEIAN